MSLSGLPFQGRLPNLFLPTLAFGVSTIKAPGMHSVFGSVVRALPIEAAALSEQCNSDEFPEKVNLTLGVYRNFDGKAVRMPVVKKMELRMANDDSLNKDYLPIIGKEAFCSAGVRLLLGKNHPSCVSRLAGGVQTIGGTGAVFLSARFLHRILGFKIAYIPKPSWPSHRGICDHEGYTVKEYRYWNWNNQCLDINGMLEDLSNAPEWAVVILHACAHNPTGMDLAKTQWLEVARIMKTRRLFPLFDIAYQGFASGDLDEDAWPIRMFIDHGFELFAAQSFSKNFGLYNERVGNLIFVARDAETTACVKSQLLVLARYVWSNPVNHGSYIVSSVLNDPELTEEWKRNLAEMAQRIIKTRELFHKKLEALGTPGNWDNVIIQRGMFSYTGLSREQVKHLREKYHIYLTAEGRMNMCGLNWNNMDYVANAFHETITGGSVSNVDNCDGNR
ncbi:Aspartate aminotransferase, cytoplasmic [Echinococcus granulosus]|uniref:Aspartate aminotransferase n=2 Tax=Echinococcus granulosus TaxID=6210 RepID=A0A068W7Q7_ECHGR|nr:Aspartate aminotransferase, cytoplasmic [Echinococcus granulosus]CDS15393.1 aspartate aminotransferase [Echinococcus granulosus]